MNIIIPMAGEGKRFKDAGYKEDKPFIDVNGKPMLQVALENLGILDATYYFLVKPKHADRVYDIVKKKLRSFHIKPLEHKYKGAVPACLTLNNYINPMEPLIVANCDQIINWCPLDFLSFVQSQPDVVGCVPTFEADSDQHSYAKCGGIDDEVILEIAEKKVISTHALCGVHYWRKACLAFWSFNKAVLGEPHFNSDYYIAPTYNHVLETGGLVLRYRTSGMTILGTPDKLEEYLESSSTN